MVFQPIMNARSSNFRATGKLMQSVIGANFSYAGQVILTPCQKVELFPELLVA
jgi:hypothetical protein